MTRTHAARQLLALGPLSFAQFADITGWPIAACRRVLSYLVDDMGEAERLGRVYRMTHGKNMPDVQALDSKGKPGNGETPICSLCAGSALGIPAAEANLPETQASGGGRCGGACRLGGEGVKA